MRLERTTKQLAARIDPGYHRRGRGVRWVRRVLIVAACALPLLWWRWGESRGDMTAFSPGPVASPHAMWDAQCATCHGDANDAAGFARHVSDANCLQCHDGAVHHAAQASFATLDPHRAGTHAAPHPHGDPRDLRSANCASCHNEHRGRDTLLARSDFTCTQCHADLTPATHGRPPMVQASVTAFAPGAHPPFGRSLTEARAALSGVSQPLVDPTPLKFGHDRPGHRKDHLAPRGTADNCASCHAPADTGHGSTGSGEYLRPASYTQHCATCHVHKLELTPGSGMVLPHEDAQLVAPVIARHLNDLPGTFRRKLEAMTEAERDKLLVTEIEVVGPPPLKKKTKKQVRKSADEWAAEQVKAVLKQIAKTEEPPAGEPGKSQPWESPVVADFYVRQAIRSACGQCHVLSDDAAATAFLHARAGPPMSRDVIAALRAPSATTQPATQPASAPSTQPTDAALTAPLATLPTGFGAGPRRWFANSRFDHAGHRFMNCLECHGEARRSLDTKDVLMPNLQSCVRCHHEPAPGIPRTAGAACQTCHTYHDRRLERPVRGLDPALLRTPGAEPR